MSARNGGVKTGVEAGIEAGFEAGVDAKAYPDCRQPFGGVAHYL